MSHVEIRPLYAHREVQMSPMPWFNKAGAEMTDVNGCCTFEAKGTVWVESVLPDGRWGHLDLGNATNCAFVTTSVDLAFGSTVLPESMTHSDRLKGGVTGLPLCRLTYRVVLD